jgi:hypothetical protein
LPAIGQISNVSAFVLPEAMPVVQDEQQVPMFPGDDPGRELLINVIKAQADGIRTLAATVHVLQDALRNGHVEFEPVLPATPEKPRRRHLPQNKELRSWRTFVAYFQNLERIVRRENHLRPDDVVTREMLYAVGAPSPKTITRIMVETHGLRADQWPPSSWSEPPADKK